MTIIKPIRLTLIACLSLGSEQAQEWIPLFNGKDIEDWTPKFADHPAGVNFNNASSLAQFRNIFIKKL